ncbi:MAG TPA: ATP-binding protein [Spirochaetota bacterium]|nr:ATP-binding protein [Spirochaetota bacterium]HRZ28015.1 ATP-binding protein [Spirochaetota bacterium]HSA16293.1 ATP-binding protein [Spirochaetota bacterium]
MKIRKRTFYRLLLFVLPDFLLALFLVLFFFTDLVSDFSIIMLGLILALLFARSIIYFIKSWFFYNKRVNLITNALYDIKKGKFILPKIEIQHDDELTDLYQEIRTLGKHLDSIFTAQKDEIDKFNDVYNSIIFSISSYFMVLNEFEKIVFATENFCNKFQFDQEDIKGKKIDDIFYFVNARLKGGIRQVRETGDSIILEKTHLLSINKVSIISDIKISSISVQGRREIILLIDDVTSKLRKDYQISLMSQISESIQHDAEIERVLYTILTGVTSGSGLGFNRAILFLVDGEFLAGKMAVGPDSFEEAIDIWSSVQVNELNHSNVDSEVKKHGIKLLEKVLSTKYSLKEDNIFIRSYRKMDSIHIYDSWTDPSLSPETVSFMDVKEFVVVPLIVGNRSIGVIAADNKFNQSPISNDLIELLSIFASQAALSIESYDNLANVRKEMQKIQERQEAIVESEKMAAVGRIAAHIAHEIRNPLVTMGGYANRISQLAKDPARSRDKIVNAAEIILKESQRLERTLSNVMDFTRPAKYIREFNNINDVISDTIRLLKNLFLEKKIVVDLDLKGDIPLVKSDFNQMKQVVLNLIQNCIDATTPGGRIGIFTDSDDENIIIRINDTGSGIDEPDPNIIFEPFFTTKITGVGLGLAIVKKIIKDHNGEITVVNREVGVEFTITLPLPA